MNPSPKWRIVAEVFWRVVGEYAWYIYVCILTLETLQERFPDGQGVREFVAILKLHLEYPARQVEQAVHTAIELGAVHLDGVKLCLSQQQKELETAISPLDLSELPRLTNYGSQPLDLHQYNLLLREV